MSIATDESYLDKNTGERHERTEWHRVVTFQPGLVDMLQKHARTGRLVYVSGTLQTRRWRKDGEESDRFSTEIRLAPGQPCPVLGPPQRQERQRRARGPDDRFGQRFRCLRRRDRSGARRPGRRNPVLTVSSSLLWAGPRHPLAAGPALFLCPPVRVLPVGYTGLDPGDMESAGRRRGQRPLRAPPPRPSPPGGRVRPVPGRFLLRRAVPMIQTPSLRSRTASGGRLVGSTR